MRKLILLITIFFIIGAQLHAQGSGGKDDLDLFMEQKSRSQGVGQVDRSLKNNDGVPSQCNTPYCQSQRKYQFDERRIGVGKDGKSKTLDW